MKPRPQHAEIELNFLSLRGAIKTPPELRRVMPLDWQRQGAVFAGACSHATRSIRLRGPPALWEEQRGRIEEATDGAAHAVTTGASNFG